MVSVNSALIIVTRLNASSASGRRNPGSGIRPRSGADPLDHLDPAVVIGEQRRALAAAAGKLFAATSDNALFWRDALVLVPCQPSFGPVPSVGFSLSGISAY